MLFPSRNARQNLLIELNPYQILAATIDRPDNGPVALLATAEFEAGDDAGLRQWLEANFDNQKSWITAYAGFTPPRPSSNATASRPAASPNRATSPSSPANNTKSKSPTPGSSPPSIRWKAP